MKPETEIAVQPSMTPAEIMEKVLLSGDLAKLTPSERVQYYARTCESVGLNPLTRPLEYISLNGKLTLYARKDATDQLRAINQVSILITGRESVEGCYVVTAQAKMPSGRTDESIGAVPIDSLKGEARSNAMMKCETKAKRRVTLSICGMGMLDESEIDSIPGAKVGEVAAPMTTVAKTYGTPKASNARDYEGSGVGIEPERSSYQIEPLLPLEDLVKSVAEKKTFAPAPETPPSPVVEETSGFIDIGMQANFASRFRESLMKEYQKQAEELRHEWLARHGYLDDDNNPTSKRIPSKEFEAVKADACTWAKKYRG